MKDRKARGNCKGQSERTEEMENGGEDAQIWVQLRKSTEGKP